MSEADERRLRELLSTLDLDRKVRLLTGADAWGLPEEPAIGLGRLVMVDGPVGARGTHYDERTPSAHTPSPTALAATWDTALIRRIGLLLAAETRAKGAQVLLAPTLNLHRSPLGGRHFECFSEDPLLVSAIGLAYVRGLQEGGVAATAKHFVANDSENERFTLSVEVAERALRELYLAPFEEVVKAGGAKVVMAAYNSVRGTTMTEHRPLQVGVLKEEWGFTGPIVSDWTAARSTAESANGGLDLVMPGPDGPWGEQLAKAVREGAVPEAEVDDKVLRLLRLAAATGVLDGFPAPAPAEELAPGSPEQTALLREAAARAMVLLRNDGVLPLAEGTRIALIGPNAARTATRGGGSADLFPRGEVSFAQGLGVDAVEGVRPGGRLPLLDLDRCTDPDTGERGLRVDYLDGDGRVLLSEHRETARLAWLGLPDNPLRRKDLRVRIRLDYHPDRTGAHTFAVTALGRSAWTWPVSAWSTRSRWTGTAWWRASTTSPNSPRSSRCPMWTLRWPWWWSTTRSPPRTAGCAATWATARPLRMTGRPWRRPCAPRRMPRSRWWWSGPTPTWRARATTAPRWPCRPARTTWSAGWPR